MVDSTSGSITPVQGFSGDGGPAIFSTLSAPGSLALDDQGNLYIQDTYNNVIRKIDAKTSIITTVADAQFSTLLRAGVAFPNPNGPSESGDGGPATQAYFYLENPTAGLAIDHGGNLYIADYGNNTIREVNGQTQIVNVIAGVPNVFCGEGSSVAPCGDGGPATSAQLGQVGSFALDPAGNLYLPDNSNQTAPSEAVVRKLTTASSTFDFGSTQLGTPLSQTFTITNTGGQPLHLTGITFSDSDFVQQSVGAADCSAATTLAPGGTCQIDVEFFPTSTPQGGFQNVALRIASDSSNATSGNNIITLNGSATRAGGQQAQTITFPALPATLSKSPYPLSATSSSGKPITYLVSGPAELGSDGASLVLTGSGKVTVAAYQFGDQQYAPATNNGVSQSFTAAPAILTVAAGDLSIEQGQSIPDLSNDFTVTGLQNGDTYSGFPALSTLVTSASSCGIYPITIAQGTLALPANYNPQFVSGNLYVTGVTQQTITFTESFSGITYGSSPIPLQASSNSGLAITFTVTGPAMLSGTSTAPTITITEAGQVTVTAQQYGNCTYAAAKPAQVSFQVAKAVLTYTAESITAIQGAALPSPLTATPSGFVNGDTSIAVTGQPAVSADVDTSTLGTFPNAIVVTAGTLASAEYSFNFVNGTLTVVPGKPQTIDFQALPIAAYGVAPIQLNAVASSGLAVTYVLKGAPAMKPQGNTLTITGAGVVTVEAQQTGGLDGYGPATPVDQSFTVNPAVLIFTANNLSRLNNTPNPPLTYNVTGFVNNDPPSVVSGASTLSTPALPGSPVGSYPIDIASSNGSPFAANYTVTFVPGALSVTAGGPPSDFTLAVTPQQVTILQGNVNNANLSISTASYYQGLISFSCQNLPADATCTFSPAAASLDGTGSPAADVLTINTNAGVPVVGQNRREGGDPVFTASHTWLSAAFLGLVLPFLRRRKGKNLWPVVAVLVTLTDASALSSCGSSSKANGTAAGLGTSTITVVAKDAATGVTHSQPLSLTIK